jgi:hypothetical protein
LKKWRHKWMKVEMMVIEFGARCTISMR